jgi:hypothetical protein
MDLGVGLCKVLNGCLFELIIIFVTDGYKVIAMVCELLGADKLIYQDLSDLVECARKGNPLIEHFDLSCFNGEYVAGDVSQGYLNHVESLRSDEAKAKRAAVSNSLQDLHTSAGTTAEAR